MASVLQTLIDGPRNLVVKIVGNGAVSAETVVDVSSYDPASTKVRIMKIHHQLDAATTAQLLWDATSDVTAVFLAAGSEVMDFNTFGGLVNNAGAGITGDIQLTTTGTGNYTIILEMVKAGIVDLDNY